MQTKGKTLKYIVTAAMFAAIIAIFTAYLFHVPITIGSNTAYLHFGDAFIFLAASLLPPSFAVPAAMIGGGLADVLCGSAVWAPFTIVVKGAMAFCFTAKGQKILCKRNLLALLPCLVVTVSVYYLAEAVIYGNWAAPVLSIWGNVVQIVGSGILYALLAAGCDRAKLKRLL